MHPLGLAVHHLGEYRDFQAVEIALDATIVGTRDAGHLRANIDAALKGPLPESVVWRRSDASRRPVPAPHMQPTDE